VEEGIEREISVLWDLGVCRVRLWDSEKNAGRAVRRPFMLSLGADSHLSRTRVSANIEVCVKYRQLKAYSVLNYPAIACHLLNNLDNAVVETHFFSEPAE